MAGLRAAAWGRRRAHVKGNIHNTMETCLTRILPADHRRHTCSPSRSTSNSARFGNAIRPGPSQWAHQGAEPHGRAADYRCGAYRAAGRLKAPRSGGVKTAMADHRLACRTRTPNMTFAWSWVTELPTPSGWSRARGRLGSRACRGTLPWWQATGRLKVVHLERQFSLRRVRRTGRAVPKQKVASSSLVSRSIFQKLARAARRSSDGPTGP